MTVVNIRLQTRDIEITSFLRAQGFATFEQLQNMFFRSKVSCSKRLVALQAAGYISSQNATDVFKGKKDFTPMVLGLNIHPLTKIYSLSQTFRRQVPETNRLLKQHLVMHQLLLNHVRFKLKDQVEDYNLLLNDPQLKTWSLIDLGRRKEFTPDLSFEFDGHSLAIELERTLKSLNRYMERFAYFQTSSYTHVHYIYVNEGHLPTLIKYAGSSRIFGFSHYLNPTEVFSNAWGYMRLNDWVAKLKTI
jgi:hypothetical protein